ncbi:MAG: hypothetical protein EZS28_045426 [Streblomastix strix]|uniref:Uncharacterized protein n=1 Tax=Streblomastix strix TaxID=222440 RepID=A0A5J4TLE9_9EUKA|nr:MAG: hypothetical protein EZS28_045426 [Streblomastix strix]
MVASSAPRMICTRINKDKPSSQTQLPNAPTKKPPYRARGNCWTANQFVTEFWCPEPKLKCWAEAKRNSVNISQERVKNRSINK